MTHPRHDLSASAGRTEYHRVWQARHNPEYGKTARRVARMRQRAVVMRATGLTLRRIGAALGITRACVVQLLAEAARD